ncbi:MAG: OmpA family protein, partial [Desulfobacteraceae bacterium]|nr:OmpA family protein [Desulfobacteraceae bacterium]
LGERRAKSAKDFLVDLGVSGSRLNTISYGEEQPAVLGHNKNAWERNRRGHFELK